ncbi:hypothetical protein Y032_0006g2821 [Ancylostoma ceylanicum]|uniref:Uncharacterized protein n=1 Tax=Ancylostoma ceylanicum TaxID=53326 RepID=A0A016VPC3_9BILA|nr:hypothetical protein Y032_0006g2821 [Ancylostoma ceylanicum]
MNGDTFRDICLATSQTSLPTPNKRQTKAFNALPAKKSRKIYCQTNLFKCIAMRDSPKLSSSEPCLIVSPSKRGCVKIWITPGTVVWFLY